MAQINELEELIRAVDRLTQSEKELAKVSGQIATLNDEIAVSEGEAREALIKKQDKLSDEQVLLERKIKLQRRVVEEEKAAARAAGVSEKAIDRATKSTKELNSASQLAARTLRQFGPVGRALATALELSRKSAGGLTVALKGVKTALISSGIGLAIVALGKAVEILAGKIKTWWKENYNLEKSQELLEKRVKGFVDYVNRQSLAVNKYKDAQEELAAVQKELRESGMTDSQLLAQRRKDLVELQKTIDKEESYRAFIAQQQAEGKITMADAVEKVTESTNKETEATKNLIKVNSEIKRLEDSIARSRENNTTVTKRYTDSIEELNKTQRGEFTSPGQSVAAVTASSLIAIARNEANAVKSTQDTITEIEAQMKNAAVNQFSSVEEYNNFMIGKAEELTAAYKQQSQERIDNEEREQQEKIAIAQYGFDALNSVLDLAYADDEDKSRKAFERNKKLQYAQTLVNGASGSVAIWTDAQSGIKEKVAAQVALALSTAVALQQIARTRYDSGGTPDTGQTIGKSATELLSQSQTITSLQTQTQAAASQTVLVVSDVDYQQNFANSTRAKAVIS